MSSFFRWASSYSFPWWAKSFGDNLNSVRAIDHYLWISQRFLTRTSQSCSSFCCSFFPAHSTSLAVAMQQVCFCEMLLFWSSVFSCLLFFFFLFSFSCNSFYVCWKTVKITRIFEVFYWWKHWKKSWDLYSHLLCAGMFVKRTCRTYHSLLLNFSGISKF